MNALSARGNVQYATCRLSQWQRRIEWLAVGGMLTDNGVTQRGSAMWSRSHRDSCAPALLRHRHQRPTKSLTSINASCVCMLGERWLSSFFSCFEVPIGGLSTRDGRSHVNLEMLQQCVYHHRPFCSTRQKATFFPANRSLYILQSHSVTRAAHAHHCSIRSASTATPTHLLSPFPADNVIPLHINKSTSLYQKL